MLVYLIRDRVNGKCYVGQTRRTLEQRFKAHVRVVGKSNACKALSDAMAKHGVENFTIELLCVCESQAALDQAEVRLIAEHGTFAPGGYNLTRGGGGKSGYKHRPESIERTVAAHRGKPLTEEHKRKVSMSLLGNKRALGLKHSEETRRLISEKNKSRTLPPISDIHRERLAAARRGTKASEATRKKMSESQKRRNAALRAESLLIAHYGQKVET